MTAPAAPRPALGMALGLLGVTIFGATLPATRLALTDFDPWFVTFARSALAGLAAVATLVAMDRRFPRGRLGALAAAAGLLVYGFPGLMATAMLTVPAAHGGVVLGVLPLATAAFAAWLADERPSRAFWAWGAAGAALVVAFALREGGGAPTAGDAALFAAGLCAALGYVVSGKLAREMPGWEVICWAMALALPLSLAGSALTWEARFAQAGAPALWALGYLAFFSMFLGFFAWNAGLALGGIARVSQTQLLQTFVTLAVAALLLDEPVPPGTLGFATAVAAVVWLGRRARAS
jgi:drug/metabolite transporter (DMT)-like permease